MNPRPVLVKNIRQKDNHTFTIQWSDDETMDYRLSDLQKMCPCAKCVDETTGKRLSNSNLADAHVRAVRVVNVGRYALRIQFTSGCSSGIYGFEMLRTGGKP